jgi:hypothetical protein
MCVVRTLNYGDDLGLPGMLTGYTRPSSRQELLISIMELQVPSSDWLPPGPRAAPPPYTIDGLDTRSWLALTLSIMGFLLRLVQKRELLCKGLLPGCAPTVLLVPVGCSTLLDLPPLRCLVLSNLHWGYIKPTARISLNPERVPS